MPISKDLVFPVYIESVTLNYILSICESSTQEIFGYLIGNILKWKEDIYIIIEEQLFIRGAIHSDQYSTFQLEGKAGEYEKEFQRLKKKKNNRNLRIVGWWHSHPGLGCFLSPVDLKTQKFFFPESYQVALVVDPTHRKYKFFTLDIKTLMKYKEISYAVISSN
ncbi:MAG: Mov34/MPN/PAD-1 family protein [Promethearchaeota archaeon]|jgi:proteasome lid subunit RPN8/RPN11